MNKEEMTVACVIQVDKGYITNKKKRTGLTCPFLSFDFVNRLFLP